MARIFETENGIVFENDYTVVTVSKTDASVLEITERETQKSIKAQENTAFFSLYDKAFEEIPIKGISLSGDIITVCCDLGKFDILCLAFEHYFTLEVVTALPKGVFKATVAHARYSYDTADKEGFGAVGVAMSISANPVYFPDGISRETRCEIYPHLADIGAKYGLIIAPFKKHQELLKELCLTIDPQKGIISKTGGAWSRDARINFSNYTIQSESSREFIQDNIEYFKSIGVDQIDIHQGPDTFRQGDFKFEKYRDAAEFKLYVSDVLEANGMTAGLHTYSHYIAYYCDTIMSNPRYQAQIKVMESFTLSKDIGAESDFVPTAESTECVSSDFGFCRTNTPYILIDREIIKFENASNGFKVLERGCVGTKAVSHHRGAAVKHLEGHYFGFCPVLGSELFYEIARNTAKAYNEGGFKMIYLDALDGMCHHCDREHENWYYVAAFLHEVLRNCKTEPILEGATYIPTMWAARGRAGAWDTSYRGYKGWNTLHAKDNIMHTNRHNTATLGWYDFYPMTDIYPGNEHTKYHHTDSIAHLGALAIKYDFPNVFNGMSKEQLARYKGLRRNVALYKQYDDLRKSQYFTEDYRQRLIDCPYDTELIKHEDGRYSFIEKSYQTARLYDLNDAERNIAEFSNPFSAQIPFIRIEAMLSTAFQNGIALLQLDETKELLSQNLKQSYPAELNLADRLAKTVRVQGNGKKGGKICIYIYCGTNSEEGLGEYIIDTDFCGTREFILLESDNGERTDHHFEDGIWRYAIYRSSLNNNRTTGIRIATEGDVQGVKMSSIVAYEHSYEVLKNPTVKVGDNEIMFECELMSSDFIEFDGKSAKVIDRYGNEKPIYFTSPVKVPKGEFKAALTARALNRTTPRAQLTFGFSGKEIE